MIKLAISLGYYV